jgi:hypothetical protein
VRAEVLEAVARRHPASAWPRYAMAAGVAFVLLAGWLWSMRPVARLEVRPIAAVVSAPPMNTTVRVAQQRVQMVHARRARPRVAPAFKSEPLVVKMITDDPQIVIYWLVDQNGG